MRRYRNGLRNILLHCHDLGEMTLLRQRGRDAPGVASVDVQRLAQEGNVLVRSCKSFHAEQPIARNAHRQRLVAASRERIAELSPSEQDCLRRALSEKLLWYVASILCELLKDGLMQPHVHLGRIAHLVLGTFEFGGKSLARFEAAIQAQELEQIHN